MPLPLPNLDDQTYAELVREARARIPAMAPNWTNYNESDPGIVLVELFAWLTEMLNYRINQIPDESYWAFLGLLGRDIPPLISGRRAGDLEEAIRAAVLALREPKRAASAADYEHLATITWNADQANTGQVARARCFPNRNLESSVDAPAPGHMSLVIVPNAPPGEPIPQPSATLCTDLRNWFEARRLVGVSLHVVGWEAVPVMVAGTVIVRANYTPGQRDARMADDREISEEVRRQTSAALQQYVNPITGGDAGRGWQLGRDVYLSELYAVLCRLPGVDHVQQLQIQSADATGFLAIHLQPHQLPVISLAEGASTGFTVRIAGREKEPSR